MSISLVDNSLKVNIYLEETDLDFDDGICVCIVEDCPDEEKLFRADETNIYITPDQAALLIMALQRALKKYRSSGQVQ